MGWKLKKYNFHDCIRGNLLRNIPPSKEKADGSINAAKKWLDESEKDFNAEAFNSCVMSSYLVMCSEIL